jgi:hypothetical protein
VPTPDSERNDMLPEVKKLREIVRCCQAGVPLDGELRRWLATSLQNFLDHRFLSVHDALGLHAPKGGVPWWLGEGLRERNAALREMAERFYPTASASRQACLIRAAALHYAARRPGSTTVTIPRCLLTTARRRRNACGGPSSRRRRCRSASAS